MQKKIISFSIWGTDPKYWIGALRNIERAKIFYPDWICRFYIPEGLDNIYIKDLTRLGGEVIKIDQKNELEGLFWRFLPASDPDVSVMLSRDTDSRLGARERSAVEEWLNSDKAFHIMRDHPLHHVAIPGGMWGAKNPILADMKELLTHWTDFEKKGCDQVFLEKIIYPRIAINAFEHSSFGIRFFNKINRFPKRYVDLEFVGNVFDEFDIPAEDTKDVIRERRRFPKILKYIGKDGFLI